MIYKNHDLERLYSMMIFIKLNHKIKTTPCRMNDDDDFYIVILYKIYNVLNDILYMGVTCDALKTCLSNYNKESKLNRNTKNKFCSMLTNGLKIVKIELIENFPYDTYEHVCM